MIKELKSTNKIVPNGDIGKQAVSEIEVFFFFQNVLQTDKMICADLYPNVCY